MRARHIQQKPYRARTPETRGHERSARVKAPVLNLEVPRTTMAPRTLEKDNPERNFTKLGWQRQHADHANPSAATGAAMSNWLSAHSDGRPPATPDIAKHTHWAGGILYREEILASRDPTRLSRGLLVDVWREDSIRKI